MRALSRLCTTRSFGNQTQTYQKNKALRPNGSQRFEILFVYADRDVRAIREFPLVNRDVRPIAT